MQRLKLASAGGRRRSIVAAAFLVAALVAVGAAAAALHGQRGARGGSAGALVKVHVSALGMILVDARGRTLYAYTHDSGGRSNCYAGCASAWPPLLSPTKAPTAAAGVRKALLGTTRRKDGRLQVVYAHHPLYTFAFDKKAGDLKGQRYEGRWFALAPSGKELKAAVTPSAPATTTTAPAPATTTTSAGGGGWG